MNPWSELQESPPETTDAADASWMGENEIIPEPLLKWGVLLLLIYFGVRLVYLAFNLAPFLPPDEITHAGLCRAFSRSFLFPGNSPESYRYGTVTNIPWLYYWIMGRVLHANVFGIPDLTFLRLCNIPFAFGTIYCVRRTMALMTENRLVHLLLVVALTNTAMFSFLSAAVSSDNLTNFLAAMAIYCLLASFEESSGNLLAASLLAQLAACLTKATFLPLVLVLGLILLVHLRKSLRFLPTLFWGYLVTGGTRAVLAVLLVAVGIGFNLKLYGGNLFDYRTLTPTMAQVLHRATPLPYRSEAQERIYRLYSQGKIAYLEAQRMAGELKDPSDRAETFYQVMTWENAKTNPKSLTGLLSHARGWAENMTGSILGIEGHPGMFKSPYYCVPIYLVLSAAILGFLAHWHPNAGGRAPAALALIALFYLGFVMHEIHDTSYLSYVSPPLELQGRYLFPVLTAMYVLCFRYTLALFLQNPLRLAMALMTALLFIAYDFPWFMVHATPEWFAAPS